MPISQRQNENRQRQSHASDESRRKTLTRLVLGGGVLASLPKRWTRPMVERVLLPAHAQASPVQPPPPPSGGNNLGPHLITLRSILNDDQADLSAPSRELESPVFPLYSVDISIHDLISEIDN